MKSEQLPLLPESPIEENVGALQTILSSQKQFQSFMGFDIDNFTPQQRATYIRDQMLWSVDEIHEALHELPYAKSWSKKYDKPEYDHDEQMKLFKEEMIDALHFIANIFVAAGMNEDEIIRMYKEKNVENYNRQHRGY